MATNQNQKDLHDNHLPDTDAARGTAPAPIVQDYPLPDRRSQRPHVIIVGAGVAGMTTAHRLLERGHDVTLIEANAFVGGKLGAHQAADETVQTARAENSSSGNTEPADPNTEPAAHFGQRPCKNCPDECSAADRADDWHEHCYHMYLNWYHNFWQLMREIGTIDRFEPMSAINYLRPDPSAAPLETINSGSPATAWQNMTSGVVAPADVFLHSQSLLELISSPDFADRHLDQMSVDAFLRHLPYTTDASRKASHRVLAKAFASPTALASASSYKSFVQYGARLPEPAMWLLTGHTEEAIFTPWLLHLTRLAGEFIIDWPGDEERQVFLDIYEKYQEEAKKARTAPAMGQERPTLTLMPLTRVSGMEVDPYTGAFMLRLNRERTSPGVQDTRKSEDAPAPAALWRFHGPVVLTIPPRQLAQLVHLRADETHKAFYERTLAGADPSLANVSRLKGASIMTLDIILRTPLKRPLPRGIVILLDAKYELSVYDNSQMWRSGAPVAQNSDDPEDSKLTQLSICASDAYPLMPFAGQNGGAQVIVWMILQELARYIDFDPEADILHCRTHLQTNAGSELFVNSVATWKYRPRTATALPDLFIAGDFVQTPIDVVTIEGAATSGLMAAEAVRRRTGVGHPVDVKVPDTLPRAPLKLAVTAMRPLAYAAKAVSETDSTFGRVFRSVFPER